jgi:HK97 family phage major capsid protein
MSVHVELRQAREERANVWEQMKALDTEAEGRQFTAEQQQKYDTLETRYVELAGDDGRGGKVAQLERRARILDQDPERDASERARVLGGQRGRSGAGDRDDDEPRSYGSWAEFMEAEGRASAHATREYQTAWRRWLSAGMTERAFDALPDADQRALRGAIGDGELEVSPTVAARALSSVTGAEGGIFVPAQTQATIREVEAEESPLLELCEVLVTATGEELRLPLEVDPGDAGEVPESTEYFEEDMTFGTVALGAFKTTRVVWVPRELINDGIVDLEAYVSRKIGERIGVRRARRYALGLIDANSVVLRVGLYDQLRQAKADDGTDLKVQLVGGAVAPSGDDVIDTYHSVRPSYRQRGTWIGSDWAFRKVRKLKDGTDQYLWSPGLKDGESDTLYGKPVRVDEHLGVPAANKPMLAFGDWRRAATIREVGGMYFQRLTELRATKGQIGFLADHRSDIRVVDAAAACAVRVEAAA